MAVAYARSDFTAAAMRARQQGRAYAALAGIRHALTFTVVIGVAAWTRSAAPTIAALTATTLVSLIALGPAMRTPGARLALVDRRTLGRFLRYSQPIVASTILYLGVLFVDRQFALRHFGAEATGKLSLATDLGFRVFLAINFLPETLLFQHAVQRETEEGRGAAERQVAVNAVCAFAILAPLAAGYMVMAPTFEALVAPPAFRGDFARLSVALAPGYFAYCALMSVCNPVFQLRHTTWPLTLAAASAFAANLALLATPGFARDAEGVARAFSVSLAIGFAIAAGAALRLQPLRPKLGDLLVVAAATGAMAVALRPLNGLHPPILAAALALAVGGIAFAGPLIAFNVVGSRDFLKSRARGARSFSA
jgi:O-antigen/teichoic acid export membrane protein